MVDIDWGDVASNLISPDVTFNRAELAALLAVFGTTVSPYLFFWQASAEVEEELDEGSGSAALTDEYLTAMRVDVIGGMASAVTIAFVIMLVAATTLHRSPLACFYIVLASSMLGGVLVGSVGIDPIRALYYAAILNGLAAPPLIALMLILRATARCVVGTPAVRCPL